MPALRYTTNGATTFARRPLDRCPVCQNPIHNGFQLTCEPGVCMYRDTPVYIESAPRRRRAA